MDVPVPPVVDVARQARIETVIQEGGGVGSSPLFNIVALVVIAIAIFFLYKRYKDKQETSRVHMLRPSPIISAPTVQVAEVDDEDKTE